MKIAYISSRISRTTDVIETTFDDFIRDKFSVPTYTKETKEQYKQMEKSERDAIKDVGGYIGGDTQGTRVPVTRQLVTLDADNCSADFLETFTSKYRCAIHTTRKHEKSLPRLRILVPLDRPVTRDEYVPIARALAFGWGINNFDTSTYQFERLMYFPSVSCDDTDYYCKLYDMEVVKADDILQAYVDYKDATSWYYADGEAVDTNNKVKYAANPIEKEGVIGAFCRAYSVSQAIAKFLSDTYTHAFTNRFSLVGATSTAGLVVYDDLYAYSNHAKDKACNGHVHNAYDLVRIHLFGHLDTSDDTKNSVKAMNELCLSLAEVKSELNTSLVHQLDVTDKFSISVNTAEEIAEAITRNDKGNIINTLSNYTLLLMGDKATAGKIRYNEMTGRVTLHMDTKLIQHKGVLDDAAGLEIIRYIESKYFAMQGVTKDKMYDAIITVANRNSYNPLVEWLDQITWDGTPRAASVFIDYLGAEDTTYTKQATKLWLTGAVQRAYIAGSKFDLMLILEGGQGIGKSKILADLGGIYYTDGLVSFEAKEAAEALEGFWIVELAELAALNRSDEETLKAFITKQHDRVRKAYARNRSDSPRRCVFAGTSNTEDLFRDVTGARRFLPIHVTEQKMPINKECGFFDSYTLCQIWAEAVHWYKSNEPTYITSDLKDMFREVTQQYSVGSDLVDEITKFVKSYVPTNYYELDNETRYEYDLGMKAVAADKPKMLRDKVTVRQIWKALGRDILTLNKTQKNSIELSLQKMGWVASRIRINGVQERGYKYEPKL